MIFNDIVKPGTPNPVVKDYKPALRDGQKLQSIFIEYDIRKPIENLPFTPTEDDVIFNFATEELKKETTLPTPNTAYGISKLVAEKIHEMWQNGDAAHRQLTIVRPGVVFGKGENGNFTRLYWAIRGHKFAYPGRKDTIKACIYVKELVRFMLWKVEEGVNTNNSNNTNGADVKSAKGVEIYNCCFEPAYTIQHIVEAMKKVTGLTQFVPDIPNWVIMPMARAAMLLGSPMSICPARVKKLQISTNICGEKLKNCGYQFKWSFEEALADWFEDNDRKYLK